jgi:hypothetical protein
MPSTQNAVNNHEYRSVPITALAESATNPRKRFDAKSLEELAASFRRRGFWPLFWHAASFGLSGEFASRPVLSSPYGDRCL